MVDMNACIYTILDGDAEELTSAERLTLLMMVGAWEEQENRRIGGYTGMTVSRERLAHLTGYNVSTITAARQGLEDKGFLERSEEGGTTYWALTQHVTW